MNPDAVESLRAGTSGPDHPETNAGAAAPGTPPAGSADAAGRVPHGSADDPGLLDFSANTNPRVPDGTREAYDVAFDGARSYPSDQYPDYRRAAGGFAPREGAKPGRMRRSL